MTRPPPHRSRRAVFSHRALQVDSRPQSGRGLRGGHAGLRSPNDPWSCYLKALDQLLVAGPVVAAPLATPVELLLKDTHGAVEELLKTGKVAVDPVVVVVSTELGIQSCKQHWPTLMSVRLAPLGEALQGVPSLLPRGPAVEMVVPRPILPPATLETQKLEAGLCYRWLPTTRDHSRLLRRQLQSEFS